MANRTCARVIYALLLLAARANGQGIIVSTAGPVNRSMGGASVAAPIDAMGAIYWNPASISGMERSEMAFGLDLVWANHSVESTLGASGSSDAKSGVVPVPNVGWVHHIEDSPVTIGLGVNGLAGFRTNLQVDPSNPILNAPPAGIGRVSAQAQFLQLAPVISVAVRENLSLAFGPTATTGTFSLEPFILDSANGNGTYPAGHATRYHWGLGCQIGAYYIHDDNLRFGASIKSPTWMETFEFYSQDETGAPRTLHAKLDLPMIVSVGTSYIGWEDWLFAADVRYMDYKNTDGFGNSATFDAATGRLAGLGWSSVMAVSLGAQRTLTDAIKVRAGYTYNQNPISDNESFVNTAAPLIYQHMISTGASIDPTDSLSVSLAYSYMPEITRTGPIAPPGVGPIPGSSITNRLDVHFLSLGITLKH